MHSLLLMYFFILFYICVVLVFDATSAVTGRPAIDKIITWILLVANIHVSIENNFSN